MRNPDPRNISPIPRWTPSKNKYIPENVSHVLTESDKEIECYHLSFQHYNDTVCEINDLVKNGSRRALLNLKTIGRCYSLSSLKSSNIDITPVDNKGAYKKIFQRLTEDVEIREHKIQSTARIFYFISDKMFYIVAITNTHIETSKHH